MCVRAYVEIPPISQADRQQSMYVLSWNYLSEPDNGNNNGSAMLHLAHVDATINKHELSRHCKHAILYPILVQKLGDLMLTPLRQPHCIRGYKSTHTLLVAGHLYLNLNSGRPGRRATRRACPCSGNPAVRVIHHTGKLNKQGAGRDTPISPCGIGELAHP
ncbi:hypothetical protein Trydic_g43 [Trypoxylus dichotomus]